jgi:putative sterol carrier protein
MLDQSTSNFQAISDLVELLNSDDRLLKLAKGWRKKVLFVVDGERYLIEPGDRGMEVRSDVEPEVQTDISFTMDHATLIQIVREEIAPIAAKMAGRIQSTGSLIDILKFVTILSNTVKEFNRRDRSGP